MRPDVLVVGAGVVGAAAAHAVAEAGLAVTVLDAGLPGSGATAAGMGHIVVMDDSAPQFALTRYSQALLERIAGELPSACELDRCGTLWIAEDEAQLGAVRAKHAYYAARGVAAEVLDEGDVIRVEPRLRPGLAGALRVPGDLVLYPPAFARWLLDAASARGARVLAGVEALRLEPTAAVTRVGRYEAGAVVNAAGAAAAALTPGLPVSPRKGHLVITDRHPGFCRHQLVELGYLKSAHTMTGESVAFNVQPRLNGQLLIGSSRELVGWDPAINPSIVGRMLARAAEFLPELTRLSAIRCWTGFRPATPDKLPLVGRLESGPGAGVWVAAGHEGLGITTALGTAQLLADLVLGRTPALDPAPYAAARIGGPVPAGVVAGGRREAGS